MKNDEVHANGQINENDFKYYLQVWKHYEDIAMHFNDLIIRLRTQSIGGLAALAAILGIFLHSQDGSQSFKCGLAVIAILCLMFLWVAIWILDMCYYNRLLEGAVNAILELEKNKPAFSEKQIKLSTNIEEAFSRRFPHEPTRYMKRWFCNGRNRFYLMVFGALVIIFVASMYNYCGGHGEKRICSLGQPDVRNVSKDNSFHDVNEKMSTMRSSVATGDTSKK